MPLTMGQILSNRYRVVKLLGQGGFGAVYRAWDMNLNRPCAVKENLDASPQAQEQFGREAMILANLIHPNLARVIDYFFLPGQGQYFVMDYVEGDDLQEKVDRDGPLLEEQAVAWIGQVCDALTYLHSQNPPVIHRDIKPANIKITPEGRAVLVDFGIAKIFDPNLKTTRGARAITPGYSPPEQYGQGSTDTRSDIYALGATLYTLVTGKTPPDSVDVITGSATAPLAARQVNPRISPRVSDAIQRAMQAGRTQRFGSGQELKAALTGASTPPPSSFQALPTQQASVHATVAAPISAPLGGTQVSPAWPQAPVPAQPLPAARRGGLPWAWITGVGGLVLALSLIVLLVTRQKDNKNPTPEPVTVAEGARVETVAPAVLTEVLVTAEPAPPTQAPEPTPAPRFFSPNPDTYVAGVYGWPDSLDPALDYDTGGGEVLINIYEPLIFYNRGSATDFVPMLATSWSVSTDGLSYTFSIRPGVKFHNGNDLTPEDVAYTFQRGLLQAGTSSPQYLLAEPLLGAGVDDVSLLVESGGSLRDDREALKAASASSLQYACEQVKAKITADDNAWTVTFHLAQPWAPFLTTLAHSWGGIMDKDWTAANRGWDGTCDTWQNFYAMTVEDDPFSGQTNGTGPFKLDHWNDAELVLARNDAYWRTEPIWPGGPSGPARLQSVVFKLVSDWDSALAMLRGGEIDTIDVLQNQRAEITPLVGETCSHQEGTNEQTGCQEPGDGTVREHVGLPSVTRTDVAFNLDINTDGNAYTGSGRLDGNGIPWDFFNDEHIRRAFNYCFDYDAFIDQAMAGEGQRVTSLLLPGMVGYSEADPYYMLDLGKCADEFHQAALIGTTGFSLWDTGFRLQIPYNEGNLFRKSVAEILAATLNQVNRGFLVEAVQVSRDEYSQSYSDRKLPLLYVGWWEDFHDAHNWYSPYLVGMYAIRQSSPEQIREEFRQLTTQGVSIYDPAERAQVYRQINLLVFDRALQIILPMQENRIYEKRWVNGWFFNPNLAGTYFYPIWKD